MTTASPLPVKYPQLNGVRGIAAVIVMLGHVYLIAVVIYPEILNITLFTQSVGGIIIAGEPAVVVFFVLSGCSGTAQGSLYSFSLKRNTGIII